MKRWKKFAALGLTAAMVLGMTACGNSSDSSKQSSEPDKESAPKTEESASAQNDAADGQEETAREEQAQEGIVYEGPDSPVTLTFWNGFTGTDGEVLVDIVNTYNETNGKNITIEMDIMPGRPSMRSFPPQLQPRQLLTLC